MAQLVMDHKGVVDDYAGDAIKADFGVPFAHTTEAEINQDAVNAVECALAMERELNRLNQIWGEQGVPTIGTRIGINTGSVVAGSLGSKQRLKYTTIGDSVNTAARLESFDKDLVDPYFAKSPCRVLISEATLKCLGDQYITKRIGEVKVKGKEQVVAVYRVLGKKGALEPFASLRSAPRVRVDVTVRISAGEVTVETPIYDLSASGLACFNLTLQFEQGEIVQLAIGLEPGTAPLTVNAKVAWGTEDRAGFAFLDLRPEDQAALERFIADRSPAPAGQSAGAAQPG